MFYQSVDAVHRYWCFTRNLELKKIEVDQHLPFQFVRLFNWNSSCFWCTQFHLERLSSRFSNLACNHRSIWPWKLSMGHEVIYKQSVCCLGASMQMTTWKSCVPKKIKDLEILKHQSCFSLHQKPRFQFQLAKILNLGGSNNAWPNATGDKTELRNSLKHRSYLRSWTLSSTENFSCNFGLTACVDAFLDVLSLHPLTSSGRRPCQSHYHNWARPRSPWLN